MERFAKVFEANDRQLLVRKSITDADQPKLSLIIMFEGVEVDLGIIFPASDEGDELLDAAFDDYDQAKAEKFTATFTGCTTAFEAACAMTQKQVEGRNVSE